MATQLKTVSKFIAATGVFGLAALGSVSSASAATIRLADATSLRSTAITFSEPDAAFLNPIYSIGGRTISFSGIIDNDLANPNSPVLFGGDQDTSGPITVSFDRNVSAVGFNAGFFNAVGSTTLTALGRTGQVLGSFSNSGTGFEFLGLSTGSNDIAGLQISSTSGEGNSFAIDDFQFNVAPRNTNAEAVPEPFTIVGTIIGGSAAMRMRKKLKSNDKV
jgi:hypothetical protein